MIVKCQQCGVKDTDKVEMIKDKKGYYHPGCHAIYAKKQGAISQDRAELDELNETIKRIHDLQIVPNPFFILLADIRNGTAIRKVQGKATRQIKQKKGVSYSLLNEAYKYSERKIREIKRRIKFNNEMAELKYCLEVVKGNVNTVYKRSKNQKASEATRQATQDIEMTAIERPLMKYTPKADKGDISAFLDD